MNGLPAVTIEGSGVGSSDISVRLADGTDLLPLLIERIGIEVVSGKATATLTRLSAAFRFERIPALFDLAAVRAMAEAHGYSLKRSGAPRSPSPDSAP